MTNNPDVILIAVGGQGKLEDKEVVVSFNQAKALIDGTAAIVPRAGLKDIEILLEMCEGYEPSGVDIAAARRLMKAMIKQ